MYISYRTVYGLLLASVSSQAVNALLDGSLPQLGLSSHLGLGSPLSLDASLDSKRCQNSPTTRSCWGKYNIKTNWDEEWPDTGVTREYWLSLEDGMVSPDGTPRYAQTINGTLPGPTIVADWGDHVVVHLKNNLGRSVNGTGLHFHGVRQLNNSQMDGVPSITQCPTAPGQEYTYKFQATQYGSSWYHSHFALQAWEGVFGGVRINGPASANYDEDLGNLFLNDWDPMTVDELYSSEETQGPVMMSTGLINGTNVGTRGGGYRFNTTFQPGTSYRMRLVNAAVDTHFKFAIDNHTLTVIAMDFVPIKPFNTSFISIGMGQRYDIIVTANQTPDNYWMRAIPQNFCSNNARPNSIRGVVRYNSSSTANPTSSAAAVLENDDCDDMNSTSLVPVVSLNAKNRGTVDLNVTAGLNPERLIKWRLNSTAFYRAWEDPSLLQIYNRNVSAFSSPVYDGYIVTEGVNVWTGVVIETAMTVPHPIHLHGHDFFVIAQGDGVFNSSSTVNLHNPPRRDVAMLPAAGHLVIVWRTDNPGTWLCHCHIGWHTEEGFALQFIERASEIRVDSDVLLRNCDSWNSWDRANNITQEDSGV